LYDAEVAEADEAFGLFLDELRRRDLYDEAVILFLSDHGEEFYEHGNWLHGRTLYSEVLHVPFILKLPSGHAASGRRVQGLVQLADVLPTLLDLLGETPPSTAAGKSVLGKRHGSASAWAGDARSFLDLDGIRIDSVQADGFKLIRRQTPSGPASAVYDVARDPGERSDLLPTRPVLGGYLRTVLDARVRAERPAWGHTEAVIDAETEENLRALGYVR
jgi:arylsulfatase A-like enzyme